MQGHLSLGHEDLPGRQAQRACEGQVIPKAKDGCNSGIGLNDDCDDLIDEDCSCTPGTSVPCYAGPADTLDE